MSDWDDEPTNVFDKTENKLNQPTSLNLNSNSLSITDILNESKADNKIVNKIEEDENNNFKNLTINDDWTDDDDEDATQPKTNFDANNNQQKSNLQQNDQNRYQSNQQIENQQNDNHQKGNQLDQNTGNQDNLDNNERKSIRNQLNHLNKFFRSKIISCSKTIEILRKDPKNPLYSVKSFNQLHIPENLLKGVYAMGFQKPSKIQETILPLIVASPPSNIIAQSQSGTGKTAAFLMGSLKRVNENLDEPQVLILAPTLELALQISDVARRMAKYTKIRVRHVTKGEIRPNVVNEHVVVGTVGKLVDWVFRFKAFDIKKIKVLILDEADQMIDYQGFREQTLKIRHALSDKCQALLFSATYDDSLLEFASCVVSDPIMLTLEREEEVVKNVNQFYVDCKDEEEKYIALANIFGNITIGQAIIFLHTKKSAKFLTEKLEKDGHKIALLTGDLETEERLNVIKRFREGDERVLITTNLTSRGIDIDQVTLVVNYDLPYDVHKKEVDYETYLHRIGRCGRFGKPGIAVSLINAQRRQEKEQIEKIQAHFMSEIKLLNPDDGDEFRDWE